MRLSPLMASSANPLDSTSISGVMENLGVHRGGKAVRQKRSDELSTSCQAVSRLAASASDEGMVMVVMALLSSAD